MFSKTSQSNKSKMKMIKFVSTVSKTKAMIKINQILNQN